MTGPVRRTKAEGAALLAEVTRLAVVEGLSRIEVAAAVGMPDNKLSAFLAHKGTNWTKLGGKLMRKTQAGRHRAPLDEARAAATPRACMCCRRSFPSEGPHHRLCSSCRSRPINPADDAYSVMR